MEGSTLNGSNASIKGIRREAIEHFQQIGIPTRKVEAWKYTSVDRLFKEPYQLLPVPGISTLDKSDLAPYLVPGLDSHIVVLVNGSFSEALSTVEGLPAGVRILPFATATDREKDVVNRHFARYADYRTEPFIALNTAFTRDGVYVHVPAGVVVEKPVQIVNLIDTDENLLIQPRILIVVERNAQVKVIETGFSVNNTTTLTNSVCEIFVGEHAFVDHYKVQREGASASQIYNLKVYQETGSFLTTDTITLGGKLVRNNLSFHPDGEHCETHLYGLLLGSDDMHVDTHTFVDHAKPACVSDELYKYILDDSATGVFNGKVYVRRDAQQTNAYQTNKSLVLSETAHMYTKPELEIYADDVKCSHGATTGRLDEEAIFYLRSRGLSPQRARALLLLAFARDVLEHVGIEPLREQLDKLITHHFHADTD